MKRILFLFILLFACSSVFSQTTLVLVRHAEKVMEGNNPGLTAEGQERARDLAVMLSAMHVDALYSTPYERTRQTLEVLAGEKQLEIREYPPVDTDAFQRLIDANSGKTLVFSGHSNTVPMLLNYLTRGSSYETFPDWEYDNLFIVTIYEDTVQVIPLKYGAVSHPE